MRMRRANPTLYTTGDNYSAITIDSDECGKKWTSTKHSRGHTDSYRAAILSTELGQITSSAACSFSPPPLRLWRHPRPSSHHDSPSPHLFDPRSHASTSKMVPLAFLQAFSPREHQRPVIETSTERIHEPCTRTNPTSIRTQCPYAPNAQTISKSIPTERPFQPKDHTRQRLSLVAPSSFRGFMQSVMSTTLEDQEQECERAERQESVQGTHYKALSKSATQRRQLRSRGRAVEVRRHAQHRVKYPRRSDELAPEIHKDIRTK